MRVPATEWGPGTVKVPGPTRQLGRLRGHQPVGRCWLQTGERLQDAEYGGVRVSEASGTPQLASTALAAPAGGLLWGGVGQGPPGGVERQVGGVDGGAGLLAPGLGELSMVSALPKNPRTGRTVEPCLRVVLDGLRA